MTQLVTVTSQGQFTIPAEFRRKLGLTGTNIGRVVLQGNSMVFEPVPDIFSLRGSVKTDQKLDFKQIRRNFGTYLGTRHLRKTAISR